MELVDLDDIEDDSEENLEIEEVDDIDEKSREARKRKVNVFSINLGDKKDDDEKGKIISDENAEETKVTWSIYK